MVILELIHAQRPNSLGGSCLLDTEPTQSELASLLIHGVCFESCGPGWRWSFQVSDLSAVDGRVLAYRGVDG